MARRVLLTETSGRRHQRGLNLAAAGAVIVVVGVVVVVVAAGDG